MRAMWTIQVLIRVWEVCAELRGAPLSLGLNISRSLWSSSSTLTRIQEGARRKGGVLIAAECTVMRLGSTPNALPWEHGIWTGTHLPLRWLNSSNAKTQVQKGDSKLDRNKSKTSFVKWQEVMGRRKGEEWREEEAREEAGRWRCNGVQIMLNSQLCFRMVGCGCVLN